MASNEKSLKPQEDPTSKTQSPPTLIKPNIPKYIYKTNKWRVKLYHLNENGQWEDFGIGYVFCALEQKNTPEENTNSEEFQKLIMLNEDTGKQMFSVDIKKNSVDFNNQRGVIITWKEGNDISEDNIAISFQEKEGALEIWNNILTNQGKNPYDQCNIFICDNQPETDLEVSIQNLPNLVRELGNDMIESKVNNFVSFLKNTNYEFILKLGELLKDEEKKLEEIKSSISTETNYTIIPPNLITENKKNENNINRTNKNGKNTNITNQASLIEKQMYKSPHMENINYIFNIIKNLILLGNKELIEILLSDDCYLITFGALEYDFETFKIVPHRKYFKEVVKFKNPLNIKDEKLLQKINQNIRLSYLRDTVLPRSIDSITIKAINFTIQQNNQDIITTFIKEEKYREILCQQLQNKNILIKRDAFLFFSELVTCCKDIYQAKAAFFDYLFEFGVYSVVIDNLEEMTSDDFIDSVDIGNLTKNEVLLIQEKIKNIIIYIIINFLAVQPTEFKVLIKCSTLLAQLTNLMLTSDNFGIKYEISNIIKMLIEINREESFNNIDLYNEIFKVLLKYLQNPSENTKKSEISITKQIIIEIFIHLICQTNFDAKFWLKQNDLNKIVINLLEENSKIVNLYTIKFLKCIIDFTDLYICKKIFTKDVCDKLIKLFVDNIKNSNIIISGLLGFYETLNQKNDELFNMIINKNKKFFTESEYKIFFKNINARLGNRPQEEKLLINYFKIDTLKDYLPKIQNQLKESDENQINNIENNENDENNQLYNNIIDNKFNEDSKLKLLEKKRKRYFGVENGCDEFEYYTDDYLNEYEEIKKRKKFSLFDEEEEDEFDDLYGDIMVEKKYNESKDDNDLKMKRSNNL